jgi:hypothetical protein
LYSTLSISGVGVSVVVMMPDQRGTVRGRMQGRRASMKAVANDRDITIRLTLRRHWLAGLN